MLQIFDGGGLWPTADYIHLPLVHLHAIPGGYVSKEVDGVTMELEIEMVFSQFLEDLCHVMPILGQVLGVDEYVVDVDDDEVMQKLLDHLVHEGLEYLTERSL